LTPNPAWRVREGKWVFGVESGEKGSKVVTWPIV